MSQKKKPKEIKKDYLCVNVFKNGETTTKSEYTKIWAELINRLQKSREETQF